MPSRLDPLVKAPAHGDRERSLDRETCARGFARAAQHLASAPSSADVLEESRELIRSLFGPDVVGFCRGPEEVSACASATGAPGRGGTPSGEDALCGAVRRVLETGRVVLERLGGEAPVAYAILPVGARGRTESALLVGYAGERELPPHVLEALLGVASLAGATLARQRAERELLLENARLVREAQEAIGVRDQFLAVASHELKTPLTALVLVIEGAERALDRIPNAPAAMRNKIAALSRQGQRLTHLVTDLLDVARIQSGHLGISIEEVDLGAVTREVAERHRQEALTAGCALEVVAEYPVTGAWDRNRVDQIVSNLVSNAIRYGGGKPISLVVESRGETGRLCVTDRGIGIAPQDHERIFRRFERAADSSGFAGMGLGLWIAREIVTRLGGSIRVESRQGAGARFTVELPIRRPPEDVSPSS